MLARAHTNTHTHVHTHTNMNTHDTHTSIQTRTHTRTHVHAWLLQGQEYTVGPNATPTMVDSLMYKACYHDFGGLRTVGSQPPGFDRVRGTDIGGSPRLRCSFLGVLHRLGQACSSCCSGLCARQAGRVFPHASTVGSAGSCLRHAHAYHPAQPALSPSLTPPMLGAPPCLAGKKDFELEHIEEAFTSEHWIVRIYKVKDVENRY